MKMLSQILLVFTAGISVLSCNNQQSAGHQTSAKSDTSIEREAAIKEDSVNYKVGNTEMKGYVSYNENQEGKRPIVLVVPEWWGLNDYPRMRAKLLAEMGYLAMAVDMYGDGKLANNPQEAQQLAGPFFQDPQLAKTRLDAALARIKTYPQSDTSKVAAIGYCFGGAVVLNAAKLGADLDGVVSFHGALQGVPAKKELLKAKVLVCHGGADSFVPQKDVDAFNKNMESIGADYTFKVYQGATHAFTNPAATETGKKFNMPIAYNPAADSASWNDMKVFLAKVFEQ
ncbi:dienelactone hydrolase family protein [Chitinophagaceae bacterium LB-8]|uniref:Dienelactone hydrolase family protein n=1 Tax=Paraflavisolibacter caeni TaxID=2982496 RepID=A0A9X3BG46_9BACT|nr:dienelactone hydrolase family protein [Paraflavisolibacter caeni]MCU7550299.1 dienelactone hydrolase family protein [Paraflavisolibacter caeni]